MVIVQTRSYILNTPPDWPPHLIADQIGISKVTPAFTGTTLTYVVFATIAQSSILWNIIAPITRINLNFSSLGKRLLGLDIDFNSVPLYYLCAAFQLKSE